MAEQMDEKEKLMIAVITACRTELCRYFPELNLAFAWLPLSITQTDEQAHRVSSAEKIMGTDGCRLYVTPNLLAMYAQSPVRVRRSYLHTLMHCLLLHINPPKQVDRRRWNLACDLCVEKQITEFGESGLQMKHPLRDAVLKQIPEACSTAREIMRWIPDYLEQSGQTEESLEEAFALDDHRLWGDSISTDVLERWSSMGMGDRTMGHGARGVSSPGVWEQFQLLKTDPRDYRPLLRKYMIPGEELELDDESFDYIYYDLGIREYGNLPLLEPLEYREVHRLEELVIAIDTSYSCDEATVRRFLQETYSILSAQENFFRKMKVVLMQCDCVLQDVTVIHSREEWQDYVWKLQIHGRGGTDFRPVFREMDALKQRGVLKKPKALLYFTDGDGVYPTQQPDFDTIFILAGKKIHPELLPRWAICKEIL